MNVETHLKEKKIQKLEFVFHFSCINENVYAYMQDIFFKLHQISYNKRNFFISDWTDLT